MQYTPNGDTLYRHAHVYRAYAWHHKERPSRTDLARAKSAQQVFSRWYELTGAKPSQAMAECGHGLTHHRCPERHGWPTCQPPGIDHASFWNLPDGRRILVYHPYDRPSEDAIRRFDARWGTFTIVSPESLSWYNPGGTFQVEVIGPERIEKTRS